MMYLKRALLLAPLLLAGCLLAGCSNSETEVAVSTPPVPVKPRVAAKPPQPVQSSAPITIQSNEPAPPPMGRAVDAAPAPTSGKRRRKNTSAASQPVFSEPLQNLDFPTVVQGSVSDEDYRYYQHIRKAGELSQKMDAFFNSPNPNEPGAFEAMKAEIDNYWSENLSYFNVPRKFRLAHRYFSSGLTQLKSAFDSIEISKAFGTSNTRAQGKLEAASKLFGLAATEIRKAGG